MNTTSYLPGQGLFNFVSEYINEESPSPAPAPNPVSSPNPETLSESVVIAEPVNSRNLWLENDKLKEEVQSMKQELKFLKSVCGLDRRLKLTKIKEEDLHKYCQYDLTKKRGRLSEEKFILFLINKSGHDLESDQKMDDKWYNYRGIIPNTYTLSFSIHEKDYLYQGDREIRIGYHLDGTFMRDRYDKHQNQHISNRDGYDKVLDELNYSRIPHFQFNTIDHDINEWFKLNITFPKLPDFMKIENMNTLDINIYKMKGIYVITYE